jgi:hypothetical protein
MSILSFNVSTTGLVGDAINPRRGTIVTTDNLATITTAGYLNNQNASGYPILPTDIFDVIYNYNPATQAGTFGIFQVSYAVATGYSLILTGSTANALLTTAINTMAAGGEIILDKSTATTTAGAATINKQSGVLTTPSLTTASGASYVITLTNSEIKTTSILLCQIMGGTNTTSGITTVATPAAGSATILLNNSGIAAAALNGTVIIGFVVF